MRGDLGASPGAPLLFVLGGGGGSSLSSEKGFANGASLSTCAPLLKGTTLVGLSFDSEERFDTAAVAGGRDLSGGSTTRTAAASEAKGLSVYTIKVDYQCQDSWSRRGRLTWRASNSSKELLVTFLSSYFKVDNQTVLHIISIEVEIPGSVSVWAH